MNSSANQQSGSLRLDLGCGVNKREGFFGIDRRQFAGVDGSTDLSKKRWYFDQPTLGGLQLQPDEQDGRAVFVLPDSSVTEVFCSHFLEHLDHNQSRPERVRFMNELWRVLIPSGTATIITPHWASNRAYGDFTHADKPVSEMFYMYVNRKWRRAQAPDNDAEFHPDGYACDFDFDIVHLLHDQMLNKTDEERAFASAWYKEAATDIVAKLVAKK